MDVFVHGKRWGDAVKPRAVSFLLMPDTLSLAELFMQHSAKRGSFEFYSWKSFCFRKSVWPRSSPAHFPAPLSPL